MNFERKVSFAAAYDKRNLDPSKNYGIHGVHITFTLKGEDGGITFSLSTNWQLPHVQAETDARTPYVADPFMFHKPQPFGVDGHWKKATYEGMPFMKDCPVTNGECWCDGSASMGDDFFNILVKDGEEALWIEMEKMYENWRPV